MSSAPHDSSVNAEAPERTAAVGVVGLGAMGWPIANRLHEAGGPVVVTDASQTTRDHARAAGFAVTDSAGELAGQTGAVVLSLPTPAIVRQVAGELWAHSPSLLICDTSTIDPTTARDLAARGPYRDTPILGRPGSVGDFDPVFTLDLMRKDAQLALDLAAEAGIEAGVVAASQALNEQAIAEGRGSQDSIAVISAVPRLNEGRELRQP